MTTPIQIRLTDAMTGKVEWRAIAKGARWKSARSLEDAIRQADKALGIPSDAEPREIEYLTDAVGPME